MADPKFKKDYDIECKNGIREARNNIEYCDDMIFSIIASRMEEARIIGEYKQALDIPIYDDKQNIKIQKRIMKLVKHYKVNPELMSRIYTLIIEESIKIQGEI